MQGGRGRALSGQWWWLIPAAVLALVSWMLTLKPSEPDLRIAVAANFKAPAELLAREFEAESGFTTEIVVGSTGKHFAQIRHGAPFHVFLAADSVRPRLLEEEGRVVPNSRWTYALGRLAAWSSGSRVSAFEAVRAGRVSLANPRLAPYGVAADAVLRHLEAGEDRVMGENVAQALQFVVAGGADVALAAFSQVQHWEDGNVWIVPDSLYPPIVQQGVLLVESEAARRFKSFLEGPVGRRIIRDGGYRVDGDPTGAAAGNLREPTRRALHGRWRVP